MDNNFKFSVIMPVYNTKDYLDEALLSIINQDIGFEENVQLILVDDGSQDNSYDICLKYQEKYPNNIIALTKENGGQGSARNLALDYADAEYITFLDSDDKLSLNALGAVYDFFSNHDGEIDLVSIPLIYFDAREGDHILNYKFKDEKIIDLETHPEYPQLAINSSFIKREAYKDYRFKTNLATGEDAIVVCKILMDKRKYGVINSAQYFYRKRQDNSSTVDTAKSRKEFFIPRLRDYFKYLIDYSLEKVSYVPKFIQYLIAYDIQWYYVLDDFPEYFSKEEIDEFWKLLYDVLAYIDEEALTNPVIIKKNYIRYFLMYLKNRQEFHIECFKEDKEVYLKTGDFTINNLHKHRFYFDVISIEEGFLNLNGTFASSCQFENLSFQAFKRRSDGTEIVYGEEEYLDSDENDLLESPSDESSKLNSDCSQLNEISKSNKNPKYQIIRLLGVDWHFKHKFIIKIPIDEIEDSKITFHAVYSENDEIVVMNNNISFRDSNIITPIINYSVLGSYLIYTEDNVIYFCDYSAEKHIQLKKDLNDFIQDLIQKEKDLRRDNRALNRENKKLLKNNKSLERKNEKLTKKNEKLNNNLIKIKEKNEEILNSTSWKITEPLRKSKSLIKNDKSDN
ncbi:glycosyltransferase [uncultured Methanobrevibacter sp.]|uniref:glycosyltransferase family A protein n=1 Tax=uncultured Methanobrevibacter sp. TaxID=253161 RepID=UPI0026085015